MTMSQREQFVAAAQACVGSRFRHQGRVPTNGIDCIGVLTYAAAASGMEQFTDEDCTNYPMVTDGVKLIEVLHRYTVVVQPQCADRGDIIVFWFNKKGKAQHVGVMTSDNRMVHARRRIDGDGRVVEHRLDKFWRERVMYFLRPYEWYFETLDGAD